MSETIEIIINAVDQASQIFQSIVSDASDMASSIAGNVEGLTEDFESVESNVEALSESVANVDDSTLQELADSLGMDTDRVQELLDAGANIGSIPFNDAAAGADDLEREVDEADQAIQEMNADLGIVNSSMLLQLAEQVGQLGSEAEGMAQDMNTAAISVGQLATQTGIAEPEMVSLINNISNATFPNDEAMMYVKSLDQMGVASENLGKSATDLDKINDAFGMGASTVNSLGQELGVLGVDMNNVSSSFNALAYANSNTVGGMQNYYSFLRKYDSQFNELGYDVDQASVIIAAATQKFGGGKAALSGLSKALDEAGTDSKALEEALDMQSGSIDNAKQLTGEYEGQLQQLADEEAEHKTLLDQIGAAWEDLSLSVSPVLEPLGSAVGLVGEVGSFGLQIGGLKTLGSTLKGTVKWIKDFNLATTVKNALEGEGAIASIASALGITTEAAAAEGAGVSFMGLAIAEGAALWPILAIVAAIVALGVVVYEVGKYFGWWTDVGSMFDAIKNNVMRLWDAFVNHPDVQAIIKSVSSAWNTLSSAIMGVINWVSDFLGLSTGGQWDVTRSIIDAIGMVWQAITTPIRAVINLILWAIDGFNGLNEILQPLGEFLLDVFSPVWENLVGIFNIIIGTVNSLIGVFELFQQGQLDLPGLVSMVLSLLLNAYISIISSIMQNVWNFANNLTGGALTAGRNFVNGIITFIAQLPGKVYNYLVNTYNRIKLNTLLWVNIAKMRANLLVNGVINYLKNLPSKVLSVLLNVVSSITSAGVQWVSSAKKKAEDIVKGVGNVLGKTASSVTSALKGVKDAIVKPFQDAYNNAKKLWDKITNLGGNTAAGFELPQAAGFEINYGDNPEFDINTGDYIAENTHDDSPSELVLDGNASFDFNFNIDGLPEGVDTNTVLKLFKQFFNDPKFKNDFMIEIAKSSLFQKYDNNEKLRLVKKENRSKGV